MQRPGEERLGLAQSREVYRGRRFVVTRAVGSNRRAVIEKTVEPGHRDPVTVAALMHEAAVLRRVEAPGLERVVALRTVQTMPVLVTEDAGSATLHDRTSRPFEVEPFLDLAVRLAEILAHVHACDVIHRDITPFNIVLDADGSPTLIDFDRAATGSSIVAEPQEPGDRAVPSYAYASPEQLGRTSHVVDCRSDLYSLGTVLYEMLTGAPPFRSDDPLEVIHAHVAKVPVSPSVIAPTVPRLISGIVLKLLSKMPESRYQAASALAADLLEARKRWRATQAIEPFELGSLDLALELPMPDRLYGREPELALLREAVERVAAGPRELVLVVGDAGIGKSALVRRALRGETPVEPFSAAEPGARFISGKFDLRAANAPFASLIEALRGLLAELKEEPQNRRDAWRARILEAVGDNGRVLTELLPGLEDLIGPPPELAHLDPFEAQTRLHVTLQAFMQVFATPGKPLVVFLDDLHWADAASLEVLRVLATDPESKHMLLVGAFRPRDVGPGHPLSRFEVDLKRAGAPASRIDLAPLTEKAIQDLLGDALRAEPARIAPLAELLARKTGGNPFFLRQILGTLHKNGLLVFDLRERSWSWGIAQIERVGITENVVELLLEAIRRLPEGTREILPLAACLGKLPSLAVLEGISHRPEAEIRTALEPAFREGLLLADATPGRYRFGHDRVQQAAYSLLSEPAREELHLRIGRLLEARAVTRSEDNLFEDGTFEVADHMNLGAGMLTSPAEKIDLARLNHKAGLKAKASSGFGPALAYMRAGLSSLPPFGWDLEPELAMDLQREAAECAYLTGDYALSDALVEEALGHATSVVQKADLHNLKVVSTTARAAWEDALEHGRRALAALGYTLSAERDLESAIAEEERAVEALLHGRTPEALLDIPLMTDPADQAVLRILVNLAHPAWWSRDRGLFRLLAFRTLRFIIERGHGPESPTAICDVAMCLSSRDQFVAADAFGSVAQDLAWRFGHPGQQAHAQFLYAAFVQRWREPYTLVAERLRRALEHAKRAGEMRTAAYALSATVIFGFASGRELDDLLRDLEDDMPFLRKTRNEGIRAFHLCYRQAIRCFKGLTAGRNQFADASFDEAAFLRAAERVPSLVCLYWIRRLHTSFIFRDFVAAHGYGEAAGQLMESMAGYVPAIEYLPYRSLCLTALCETGPAAKRAEWLANIADNQRRLACWAQSCPANFRHLYVLVEAEVARIDRRLAEAADLYDEAIEAAGEAGFVHDAAVASELAGRHALSRGRIRIADLYLRKARERYSRWGATEKVRALEEEFPEMGRSEPYGRAGHVRDSDLDILSLLRSSETISTEVELDRLLERLIHVCAEAAGADRVVVVLEEDGEPYVRAMGTATGRVAFERTALAEGAPLARHAIDQARLTRRPLVIDEAVHDPRVASDPYVTQRAMKSILAVPVQRQAMLVATLYFENNLVTHAFTSARLRVLELLSAQIAGALENSLLFEKLKTEVTDRRRAEHSVRFLADAGTQLAESLDEAQIFEKLTQILVPALADWCAIDLLAEDRRIRRVTTRHADPEKASLVREFRDVHAPDWSSNQLSSVVLRTGAAVIVEDVTEEILRAFARDSAHMNALRALGMRSVIVVPMIAHGRTIGAITFGVSGKARRYGTAEVTVGKELAQRAALAIDNAHHFQKAREAVRVREEFLSVAAHELHTPVTSLHLMMQGLSRGGLPVTPEVVRQTFGVADRQVKRLIKLIDQLLDVSRIDAGRFPLDRERVDLGALVRDVAERFVDDAARAGSTVTVEADQVIVGDWDRMRLEQVASNLLSNAIKFGAGRPVEVVVFCADGEALLKIQDHGIGVPPDRLPHIFERFERGVSSRQYGGLGLGLYIVRSIVDSMGGWVRCEPTPEGGSTFLVALPSGGDGSPCDPEPVASEGAAGAAGDPCGDSGMGA